MARLPFSGKSTKKTAEEAGRFLPFHGCHDMHHFQSA
jgi:hypothetical protein